MTPSGILSPKDLSHDFRIEVVTPDHADCFPKKMFASKRGGKRNSSSTFSNNIVLCKQRPDNVGDAGIDGIDCPLPEETIHSFPDISVFGKPLQQIAEEILAGSNVVTETGSIYSVACE